MPTVQKLIAVHKSWKARKTPMPERFWMNVEVRGLNECWPWKNTVQNNQGHGAFKLNNQYLQAHRVAFELAREPIPEGKWICHHCDNPPCCNPIHLYIGDAATNGRDSRERQRYQNRKGEAHPRARFTNEEVLRIRSEFIPYVVSERFLAKKYNVPRSTIHSILRGDNYAHF